jgi:triphosphoribosyl-dephospho-CoA synthetase
VTAWSLPVFREALAEGRSHNEAGVMALLHLIARVEDTNLYHRGGPEGAAWAKAAAAALLPSPEMSRVEDLDEAFIARNLSPGGCADLLAVTWFLHMLEMWQRAGI